MAHLSVLIEFVCDAHTERDPRGPLVTRIDDAWAYCAGHGDDGHQWRRIVPTQRGLLEGPLTAAE